ncbi:family 16 glycosylhydrolase [Carboxylicivirga sediminis]|uniref:Family 16 glycosylhydrolase n=1 Tax=Carboxylicivirga sediminis TaxID=2006564 RepID=A0A941F510_9BACT|nr:family 16 glycosylhydrolase [Carboxylicivirga sediminis]MBR8536973.1 family 16 glycosylhydrolase [Carboxylicivirga sediminis]
MGIRIILIGLTLLSSLFIACGDESPQNTYVPDFEINPHPSDANVFVFRNTTQSEHYYWRWDFGNGERTNRVPVETTEMQGFYPEKGTYTVTLTIWGSQSDWSDNKQVSKQIVVENDVYTPAFEVTPVDGKTNTYRLTNTSSGEYDKVSWLVNDKVLDKTEQNVEVYFPFEGENKISISLSHGEFEKTMSEILSITEDDPDFRSHYQLVWNDDFDDGIIDKEKWLFETGQHGWGNAEWQNYTDGQNIAISDGTLKIIARKSGEGQQVGDYTSARINSKPSFTYGIFEICAKMPDYQGPGVWPAIWMLGQSIREGTNWPLCGEMDIMEYVSWDPDKTSSAIHIESNNHAIGNAIGSGHVPLETAEEAFHIYGLIWTDTELRFYRDDCSNILLTYKKPANANMDNWPFDQPFYFLLNMAVGGNYGGVQGVDDDIFPATMEVDYVHVYQMK